MPIQAAKEILNGLKQRGVGFTSMIKAGTCAYGLKDKSLVIGVTRLDAQEHIVPKNALKPTPITLDQVSTQDRLKGINAPFVLTHMAIEFLLERLLTEIERLRNKIEENAAKSCPECIILQRQVKNQATNISILSKRLRDAGLSDRIEPNDKEKLGA